MGWGGVVVVGGGGNMLIMCRQGRCRHGMDLEGPQVIVTGREGGAVWCWGGGE